MFTIGFFIGSFFKTQAHQNSICFSKTRAILADAYKADDAESRRALVVRHKHMPWTFLHVNCDCWVIDDGKHTRRAAGSIAPGGENWQDWKNLCKK